MSASSRRDLLKVAGLSAAAAVAAPVFAADSAKPAPGPSPQSSSGGAADLLRIGVIGPGGQGTHLLQSLSAMKDVRVAYVCDIDRSRRDLAAERVKAASGHEPKREVDFRRVLDDRTVDAVVIATPDHWHAPATILACDAGKHVYVEKPASHNLREGRLMIEATRRNKRILQVGTQSRSTSHVLKAMELLRGGAIGEVLVAKAWNSQLRRNIGKQKPDDPPDGVDYDQWIGPAPFVPFQKNRFHGVWRWWHAFGTGDIGNDGVHDIDIARWGLGVTTHPSAISALGGKYFFDDDQEWPDTMTVAFEYPSASKAGRPKQLIFEERIWSPYTQEGHENGNAFYGTRGMLILGKHNGWALYKTKNEKADELKGSVESTPHHRNWLDCIRNGGTPNADIEVGHLSSSLSHLGNIAIRVGRSIKFDPQTEKVIGDEQANTLLSREYRAGHWAVPKGI
jgi:predicted dehydrogenase